MSRLLKKDEQPDQTPQGFKDMAKTVEEKAEALFKTANKYGLDTMPTFVVAANRDYTKFMPALITFADRNEKAIAFGNFVMKMIKENFEPEALFMAAEGWTSPSVNDRVKNGGEWKLPSQQNDRKELFMFNGVCRSAKKRFVKVYDIDRSGFTPEFVANKELNSEAEFSDLPSASEEKKIGTALIERVLNLYDALQLAAPMAKQGKSTEEIIDELRKRGLTIDADSIMP